MPLKRGLRCQLGQVEEAPADWLPGAWIFVENVSGRHMVLSSCCSTTCALVEKTVTQQASHWLVNLTLLELGMENRAGSNKLLGPN